MLCAWPVGRILLTQIGKSCPPYDGLTELVRGLCERGAPAYDGLVVNIPSPG